MGRKVKFYTKGDLASGFNLEHAAQLLDKGITPTDINDIIEIYNINKYFDEDMRLKSWTDDDFNSYKLKAQAFNKNVYIFFNSLKDDNFVESFEKIEYYFTDNFWYIFNTFKCYNKISNEKFKIAAQHKFTSLEDILQHKQLVSHYDITIKEILLDDIHAASIILTYHNKTKKNKNYLPQSLSLGDKVEIIKKYINSENAHPGTLNFIIQLQPSKEFTIPPRIKLKAKEKCQEIEKRILETGTVLHSEMTILFQEQYECAICKISDNKTELIYSRDWIEKNPDFPTLLNNFIYMFEFVNKQNIFRGISRPHEMGVFERAFSSVDDNYYSTSTAFNFKFTTTLLQMVGYATILEDNGISLSQIIEWFFSEYLKEEFNIENFNIFMPSEASSYLEKCTFLMTVIDSILKQYEIYIEEGYVDSDILSMQSNSKKLNDIQTLLKNKYVFGKGQNYALAANLFFSDQSDLAYTPKNNGRYKTFFDSFKYVTPLVDDFEEFQKPRLNWLIDNNFILVNEHGEIYFKDLGAVIILKHLFECGSAKASFYKKNYFKSINRLYKDGYIEYYSTLFTKEEVQYLNFFLNKAEFRNGLDLRNKYAHGVQHAIKNNEEHIQNYNILLHIIILLIIKINDDLCTQDNKNKTKMKRANEQENY